VTVTFVVRRKPISPGELPPLSVGGSAPPRARHRRAPVTRTWASALHGPWATRDRGAACSLNQWAGCGCPSSASETRSPRSAGRHVEELARRHGEVGSPLAPPARPPHGPPAHRRPRPNGGTRPAFQGLPEERSHKIKAVAKHQGNTVTFDEVEAHAQALARAMPKGPPGWPPRPDVRSAAGLLFVPSVNRGPSRSASSPTSWASTDATPPSSSTRVERRGLARGSTARTTDAWSIVSSATTALACWRRSEGARQGRRWTGAPSFSPADELPSSITSSDHGRAFVGPHPPPSTSTQGGDQ